MSRRNLSLSRRYVRRMDAAVLGPATRPNRSRVEVLLPRYVDLALLNCFLLFFVSGELFPFRRVTFMKPPNFSVIKKRFKKECFLTLLYDEWKPVSLSFFLCQKRSVSRNNVAKKRNRKSQYTSGGNMYFNQALLSFFGSCSLP